MASAYKAAAERTVLFENPPINDRQFALLLVDPKRVQYDAEQETLKEIFKDDLKDPAKYDRVALRTQVIPNPKNPVEVGDRILQFFAVATTAALLERHGAILIENIDGDETPLFNLNPDEVAHIAHGGGFNVAARLENMVPAA